MTQPIEELNSRFSLNGAVRFETGENPLVRATIEASSASATIYLHGAHVAQYQPREQAPLLFMSSRSFFEPGKPIRGGVPVIFPWFGPRDDADRTQMHGLVRTLAWEVRDAVKRADGVDLVLGLKSSEATRSVWPFEFDATFTLGVGPVLKMTLAVRNMSAEPFSFEEGLHTYFAVSDVREISVHGLRGHWYRDKNISPDYQLDTSDTITFPNRTDRLYRDARGICTIKDPGMNREIVVAKENSATTVVWNPGEMAPGEFADLASENWPRFVCVETCNARHNAYTLGAGQTHSMSAMIQARAMQ